MARSSNKSRRLKPPYLLILLLCASVVLFALSLVTRRPTAQVIVTVPGAKLTVAQKSLASADTVVSNQKDVNLLRFEARAQQPGGVRLSSAAFSASQGKVSDAQSYSLWVDTNGDYTVDTVLQRTTARDGLVAFNSDYLLPGTEECETDVNCMNGQTCTGCRCTTPGTALKGQLISPTYYGSRCSDSDGGRLGNVKGTTSNVRMGTRIYPLWMDTCLKDWKDRPANVPADSFQLLEGYCPMVNSYGQVTYPATLKCNLGCSNGACLEALLGSVSIENATVRVSYAKTFSGCATLMDEKNSAVSKGSKFCKTNETVTYNAADFRLIAGQKVKLCSLNGKSCSPLVVVTSQSSRSSALSSNLSSRISSASSRSSALACAEEGQRVYSSSVFGPTLCCSKNAGIKPSAVSVVDMCIAPTDGSIGTCIDNWWLTCGNGTCNAGEDRCNCPKDCPVTSSSSAVCITEGNITASGKTCCSGLNALPNLSPYSNGTCPDTTVATVCVRQCGDGSCTKGENFCNCPKDCPSTVYSVISSSSSRVSSWSSIMSSSSRISSSSAGHVDCYGPNGTMFSVPIGQPCPVISSSSYSSAVSSIFRCVDSDSNAPDQFYTSGSITTNEKTYADDCSGKQLLEWVCSTGYPTSKYITCPTACVEEAGPDGLTSGHCQATCGDGVKEGPSELCDDGNTMKGDGCSATCTPEPVVCGNGRVESPEQCDIGTACSDGRICEIGTCLCKPALCVAMSSSSSSIRCTDTDGGKNYYLFGRFTNFVFGNTVLPDFSDVCFKDNNHNPSIDPNILLEGYCGEDGFGHQEQYTCPYGCANAACLPPPASSAASSSSSEGCAQEGQKVYGSSPFGPTHCCSKNAGIKPSAVLAEDMCIAPTDGSIGTCIENWWLTCGNGTCDAGEDRCNCLKDCQGGPVCGNSKVEGGEECDGSICGQGSLCVDCRCRTVGSCGNGFVDSAKTIVFEVHADIAVSPAESQLQLQFSALSAEDALTGRSLVGLSINGACDSNVQSCEMSLTTMKSTLFNLRRQGDLYVSLDPQTIGPRQLLAGSLGEPILRVKLHAEYEDVDVTDMVFNSSGSMATSVDALELWQEGATERFAVSGDCGSADVLTTNAGSLSSATRAFCFATEQQQLVVPKGADLKILVRPRLKNDTTGAISGETFALFVDHTATSDDATGTGSVRARGRISSNNLFANNGDSSADGEIFIGRPKAAAMNIRIIGNTNSTVLSKIVTIANGGEANGTVPGGADREIGSFRFAAAANANYRNGMNTPELTDLIFTVNAINVSLSSNGFKIYNRAASSSQSESCSPFSADGSPLSGTVSGVFLVRCSMPSTSVVNSMIDSGESLTLVLAANVTNTNTAASSGGSSVLQVSLNNFSDIRRSEFGLSSSKSFLRWKDRDNAGFATFTWVEYPDSAVNSTTFRG